MGIHEQDLEVSQRDQPKLHGSADGFTTIGCVELPEKVVKVRLDGWDPKAELLCQPFCRKALCHSSQYLHFPGRQSDSAVWLRQRRLFGDSAENVWDHLPRHWAFATDG